MSVPKVELNIHQQREQATAERFYVRLKEIESSGWYDLPDAKCGYTSSSGAIAEAMRRAFLEAGLLGVSTRACEFPKLGLPTMFEIVVPRLHQSPEFSPYDDGAQGEILYLTKRFALKVFRGAVTERDIEILNRFVSAEVVGGDKRADRDGKVDSSLATDRDRECDVDELAKSRDEKLRSR